MAGFKPVEFKLGRLSLKSGGHLNKETVVTTKDIGTVMFIQVKSRDAWLQAATMGKTTRGEMYTGVLDDLRNIVLEMEMKMGRKIQCSTPSRKAFVVWEQTPWMRWETSSLEIRTLPCISKSFNEEAAPSRAKSAI